MKRSMISLVRVNFVAAMVTATSMAAGAALPSTVAVSRTSHLGPVTPIAVGTNAAVWDSNLLDTTVPDLFSDAGVRILRYPGGSTADVFHWQSNTTLAGQGYADPRNTLDAYMEVVEEADARAMITVNYGSGTPDEAAGWVQYANMGGLDYSGPVPTYAEASITGHRYHVKYWEMGNEIYGNSVRTERGGRTPVSGLTALWRRSPTSTSIASNGAMRAADSPDLPISRFRAISDAGYQPSVFEP